METTPHPSEGSTTLRKWSLPVFLAVAFGGAWLVVIPLWLSGEGIKSPMLGLTASIMMFMPSLGVLVTWLVARRHGVTIRDLARDTGLGLGPRKRRTVAAALGLWFGLPLFVVVSTLICAALGLYQLDIGGLGLFREYMSDLPGGNAGLSAETMAILTLVLVAVAPILNIINCLGEEWGWRGFLMPRLLPYGRAKAILVSGAIWGAWHAPVTLLGYNYEKLGPWSALMFVPFCMVFGALLSWTRLTSGSVWPAVIGHGAFNGSTGLVILIGAAGQDLNLAFVGPISVAGMALMAVLVAVLFRKGTGNLGFRPSDAALDGR